MPDLQDGETVEMKGSAAKPYEIKNVGGVYSCSCPAWRNQSLAIEQRVELPISLVAAIPGRYTGPASRGYLYYTDEYKHWTNPLKVTVTPKSGQ